MDIIAQWHKPLSLRDGWRDSLIYACDLGRVPEEPGIYVFARRFGDTICPLYIGKSVNLRARVKSELNTVRLMKGIQDSSIGKRVLFFCTMRLRPGQNLDNVLHVVECACIDHALSEGHELLNKQGTKTPTHSISCQNRPRPRTFPFPKQMKHRKA